MLNPTCATCEGAPFGHAPGKAEHTAKQVIFPTVTHSTEESDAIYKKSHGTLGVAEQRTRGYDWDKHNIKPGTYVFGSKPQNIAFNGVSKSIADVLTTTEADRGPVVIQRSVSESVRLTPEPLALWWLLLSGCLNLVTPANLLLRVCVCVWPVW